MKITCLVENTTASEDVIPRHGLSLLIETRDHTLLFDTGPDRTFADNARHLGIDLKRVDTAVISHGHYDHGGGLPLFQKINPGARVFMTQGAMGRFFVLSSGTAPKDIGLNHGAIDTRRCTFISEDTPVSDALHLFTGFTRNGVIPAGNAVLYRETPESMKIPDDFTHELALLVREGSTTLLLTGCSHSGLGNMLATVLERTGLTHVDHVVGGFHLYNPSARQTEPRKRLDRFAGELLKHPRTRFHTGHCTGPDAPAHLKKILGDRLTTFSTGSRIET